MSKFDRYAKLLFSNIANPQQSNSNLSNQPSSPSHLNLLPADGRSKHSLILILWRSPGPNLSPRRRQEQEILRCNYDCYNSNFIFRIASVNSLNTIWDSSYNRRNSNRSTKNTSSKWDTRSMKSRTREISLGLHAKNLITDRLDMNKSRWIMKN